MSAGDSRPPSGRESIPRDAGPHGGLDHITPYDRLVWTDDEVERLLASGEQRQELEAYFGAQEYRELARLARAARGAPHAAGTCRTFIVPGVLGSQLGVPRRDPLPRDILWLDPIDIGYGRLTELALPGATAVRPYGVLLYSYLGLKLRLRAAGVDAVFHPYDWRLGIEELGRALARRVQEEPVPKVAIVAHSLGGLVSRAALAHRAGGKVERLVLLGTPNRGSLAALQALRGTYWAVRKLAQLDVLHSAEALASALFNTFPSLYDMLPHTEPGDSLDLHDPTAWPPSGPQPVPALLESARAVHRALAPPDERFACVAGTGQGTATAVTRRGRDFVYTVTRHGDGTVPVESARLGVRNYIAAVKHSDLTRDRTVAAAVVDLLRSGSTRRLSSQWKSRSRAEARVSDTELGKLTASKVDWSSLSADERRVFLEYLNEPPQLRLRVPERAGTSERTGPTGRAGPAARAGRTGHDGRPGRTGPTRRRR
ncbi:MAG: lipase family alpha/beta hydrolase [Steroidobacteraceae bacterium]